MVAAKPKPKWSPRKCRRQKPSSPAQQSIQPSKQREKFPEPATLYRLKVMMRFDMINMSEQKM
jgi:hypothetical protein